MKFAILGAGGIAHKMAYTVSRMQDVELTAIASRDIKKTEPFVEQYGVRKAYGSYEAMLADPEVELVYIAVPHSHHCEWTKKALEAGKHVLCEKAFAVNASQAEEMIDLARKKGLLLAEAIWTRYMPSRRVIEDLLAEGVIGEVHSVSANLGYRISMNERMIRPELAGGCLLDLTVYTLNFASMVLGDDIEAIHAHCMYTDTGVDGQDNVMIAYKDGRMASMMTTMYTLTDRSGYIYGTDGFIEVVNINNPEAIRVWSADREGPKVIRECEIPWQITGYEYEVMACMQAIRDGQVECAQMPHDEILEIMHQMDVIRGQLGIVFDGIE